MCLLLHFPINSSGGRVLSRERRRQHMFHLSRFRSSVSFPVPHYAFAFLSRSVIGPSQAVDRDDGSTVGLPQRVHAPGVAEKLRFKWSGTVRKSRIKRSGVAEELRIKMDDLDACRRELESLIQHSRFRRPKSGLKPWLQEVEKQYKDVEMLLDQLRKKDKELNRLHKKRPNWIEDTAPLVISADELMEVTNNFSDDALIYHSLAVPVYYAVLKTGTAAAIKRFVYNKRSHQRFMAWVSWISMFEHENVVGLLGSCFHGDLQVLAYEFATMGSLHDVLHGRKGVKGAQPGPVLSWAQRARIAVGAAEGLEYLHEAQRFVHQGIKSSNVLLFNDCVAKIDMFDPPSQDQNFIDDSHLVPQHAWQAPDEEITSASDVYSFGVVLLELLTGRELGERTLPRNEQNVVTWATPLLAPDEVNKCIDPRLGGDYPPKAAAQMAAVAAVCLKDEYLCRPTMDMVVKSLRPLLEAYPHPGR